MSENFYSSWFFRLLFGRALVSIPAVAAVLLKELFKALVLDCFEGGQTCLVADQEAVRRLS